MPREIIRNDIARVKADAIVNTANPEPLIGAGTDHAIHRDAGPQLLEARKAIGNLQPGQVAVTPAFGLDARYVIHAVGPKWRGGNENEEQTLRQSYDNALEAAIAYDCKTVAFPLMSTGTYGFPKEKAIPIAISTFTSFLMTHQIEIILVVFDKETFEMIGQLRSDLRSYVDERYVGAAQAEEYEIDNCASDYRELTERLKDSQRIEAQNALCVPSKRKKSTFQEMLFQFISDKGLNEVSVYQTAGLSRQHFSKIRSNKNYYPQRDTVLKLALVMELDFDSTQEFLRSAGYALSDSIANDIVVAQCIRNRIYDFSDIDCMLAEQGLSPLFYRKK